MNNKNTLNGILCVEKKIHEIGDTVIFLGKYHENDCIIKQIKIFDRVGIKSKVLREISFLKKFKHDNIVVLYDVIHDYEYIYLILEKGSNTLHDIIKEKENIIDLNKMINDVLCALSFIESVGYIHGDLNLTNIIQFDKNTFKLIDFGLSTKIHRINSIKKPAPFVQPLEMKLGEKIYSDKIDSWGLGSIKCLLNSDDVSKISEMSEMVKLTNDFLDDINFLLNDDPTKRLTIQQYCLKKRKYNNIVCPNIILKNKIFCNTKIKKHQDKYRKNLVQSLLEFNILNNLNVENIFLTIELLQNHNVNNYDDYVKNGIIYYYLATKFTTSFEFQSNDAIILANNLLLNKKNFFESDNEFNKNVLDILSLYNWDIDVPNQLSYLQVVSNKNKHKYIIFSLIVLLTDDLFRMFHGCIHESLISIINDKKNDEYVNNCVINSCTHECHNFNITNMLLDMWSEVSNETHPFSKIILSYHDNFNFSYY